MANDKNKKDNPHKDHRKRMLDRYIKHGINSFQEHEVIELLLYLAYPQGDVNPKAHMLLEKFGSISNLLNASVEELIAEDKNKKKALLTDRAAFVITLIRDIDKYAKISDADNELSKTVLSDVYDVGRFCCKRFGSSHNEILYMVILDSLMKVKSIVKISEGNSKSTIVSIERIVMHAIKHKAHAVILCHNHPGGNLDISNADISATNKVAASLNSLDIALVDHIVCCDDKFESMRQRGMIMF